MNNGCPFSYNQQITSKAISEELSFKKIESTTKNQLLSALSNHSNDVINDLICNPDKIEQLRYDKFLGLLNWSFQEPLYDIAIKDIKKSLESEISISDGPINHGKIIGLSQLKSIHDKENLNNRIQLIGKFVTDSLHKSFIKSYEQIKNGNEGVLIKDIHRLLKIMNQDMEYMYTNLNHEGFIYNNCYSLEITLNTIQNAINKIYIPAVQSFLIINNSKVDFEITTHNSKELFINYSMNANFGKILEKLTLEGKKEKIKYNRVNNKFTHNFSASEFWEHKKELQSEYGKSKFRGCALLYKEGGKFGEKNALLDFNSAIFKVFSIYLQRAGLIK